MPTKNEGFAYMMWYILCLDLRSNSGKACGVPGFTEGLFLVVLCVERDWHREYLPPFVLRATDSDGASRLCKTRRQTHNKDFDFKTPPTMIHEGLPVSVAFLDLFITGTGNDNHGHSVRTGVNANKYEVIASSHRVSPSHTHTHTWYNATVVTVFSSSSFVEFSIKLCLLWKSKVIKCSGRW